jgi:hypothetical protein
MGAIKRSELDNNKTIIDNYIYLGQVEYELRSLEEKLKFLRSEKRRVLVSIESLLENTHEK